MTDIHTEDCVLHRNTPSAPKSDFCAECLEAGADEMYFGRCYFCKDFHQHEECVGAPCQCPCGGPDEAKRQRERAAVLAKLTPEEMRILGVWV